MYTKINLNTKKLSRMKYTHNESGASSLGKIIRSHENNVKAR